MKGRVGELFTIVGWFMEQPYIGSNSERAKFDNISLNALSYFFNSLILVWAGP